MSASTRTSETMRLQYLQAIGITSYFPRTPLPGAAPSRMSAPPHLQDVPRDMPQDVSHDVPQPEVARVTPATAAITESLRQVPVFPASPPQAAPVITESRNSGPAVRPAAVAEPGALHFQLLLLQVDAELAVLCQVPALAPSRLLRNQQQLLGNMLRWLDKPMPGDAGARVFKWPLPGVALTNNRQEAGTSLSRFMEQAAIEQPFSALLLLGEQATECLHDHARRNPDAQARPWQLYATHSLDEMLALPALKREVWQTLLPLHAALQRSVDPSR